MSSFGLRPVSKTYVHPMSGEDVTFRGNKVSWGEHWNTIAGVVDVVPSTVVAQDGALFAVLADRKVLVMTFVGAPLDYSFAILRED